MNATPQKQPDKEAEPAVGIPSKQPCSVAEPVAGIPVPVGPTRTPSAVGVPVLPANGESLTLTISGEREHLDATAEQTLLAMVSLKAPATPTDMKRPPVDLVACIDKSGSMHGSKMSLMKQTLELLVTRSGFGSEDRLAIVTFDATVSVELPLSPMSAANRPTAEKVIKRLTPGSTTNLSGGLLQAIDLLGQAQSLDPVSRLGAWLNVGHTATPPTSTGKPERTRAVMLFTDGMANNGIQNTADLVAAANGALSAAAAAGGPVSLYTFGFGSDHDEDCLRRLATGSGASGLYYALSKVDDIPQAFADCLGGLTSVVAQNTVVSLQPEGGCTVSRILGSAYARDADGAVLLGDLFAEDEKDLLVELTLPALQAPASRAPVLKATLRAFNVTRLVPEMVHAYLEVSRPEVAPKDQRVNPAIDAQRNRVLTAEAMEQATRLADAGDLAAGRRTLERARERVAASESRDHQLSSALVRECESIEQQFQTRQAYRDRGSKMSQMHMVSHSRQRAVHSNPGAYRSGATMKATLKAGWMGSLRSNEAGNVSD